MLSSLWNLGIWPWTLGNWLVSYGSSERKPLLVFTVVVVFLLMLLFCDTKMKKPRTSRLLLFFSSAICVFLFPCHVICITCSTLLSCTSWSLLSSTSLRSFSYHSTATLCHQVSLHRQTSLFHRWLALLGLTRALQVHITDNGVFMTRRWPTRRCIKNPKQTTTTAVTSL